MYKKEQALYCLMLLPAVALLIIFSVIPMIGIVISFQDFLPGRGWFGSPWVGFRNFEFVFTMPDSWIILRNTLFIASGKIILGTLTAILFALLLNEIRNKTFKKLTQTAVYLPHFISWVIYATIMRYMLTGNGVVNNLLGLLGIEPVLFLSKESIFPWTLIITDVLKEFGFTAVIYLASISNIDPTYYEAAIMDGAGRFKQTIYITIPSITPTIVLMAVLSMGNILQAGFDQVFNMYSPAVYVTGDIIDTYVYRVGLMSINYGLGTAVGLLKSVVSFTLITISYWLANKFANYRLF